MIFLIMLAALWIWYAFYLLWECKHQISGKELHARLQELLREGEAKIEDDE